MTVTEALEKLKTYEQTSFALGHAMGLLYYDGVTVAPKGAAAVRGDTSAELSRIDYQLTTAPTLSASRRCTVKWRSGLSAASAASARVKNSVSSLCTTAMMVGPAPEM